MKVKLAASMLVCFNANRQSNELPAKAIIAKSARDEKSCRFHCVFYAREMKCTSREELIAGYF